MFWIYSFMLNHDLSLIGRGIFMIIFLFPYSKSYIFAL